ncbi:MAG TPA: isoaspartyl peptidase/L-asparaginase [Abditibacterium sp.]|jgi:beta-aspartyl-peptidase (threonine type)
MTTSDSPNVPFALAIHGGSGNISPLNLPPEQENACRAALTQVLEAGHARLRGGASSLDVVEEAVRQLEDCPLFNAGRGATFTHDGRQELDAAIMDGATHEAGAVAGVSTIAHPVSAARAVMERSPHVLLIGAGAEEFAASQSLEIVDPSHFYTQSQWEKWDRMRQSGQGEWSKDEAAGEAVGEEKFGTVGAVALDQSGNLAAATSTGGMIGKRFGRVGDSPIIGAGTYASNASCAVSATGHGEHFLCNLVAYDIAALMEYRGLGVRQASEEAVLRKLTQRGGEGGVIAISNRGEIALTFNALGMYRGSIAADGTAFVAVFRSETV